MINTDRIEADPDDDGTVLVDASTERTNETGKAAPKQAKATSATNRKTAEGCKDLPPSAPEKEQQNDDIKWEQPKKVLTNEFTLVYSIQTK